VPVRSLSNQCAKLGQLEDQTFAEGLLPADEEMLEKELSELDELGLVSPKANPNPCQKSLAPLKRTLS
jgi:hypothetical protein